MNETLKRSRRSRLSALLATVVVLGGLSLAGAGPANALGSCSGGMASDGAYRAVCGSGTGQVRAWVACKSVISLGYTFNRVGSWANAGTPSVAKCGIGEWNLGYGGWENR
ncbi:hypothetical protein [Agreia sp. COWG]|uniref:hypothetical protein n=1 Tax=Agreia sp. COWG TaxID=2773266 RepID=UPI0019267D8A|nr:hypothetical protein [Agreia sp. COWG]